MKKEYNPPGRPSMDAIDWTEIHRSIDAAKERLTHAWEGSSEERKAILRERAKLLDRVIEKEAVSANVMEVVEFRLAQVAYAIESSFVQVVCPLKDFTPLPCTPPFVLGLLNVRGRILSIVDLRKFFQLPEVGLTDLSKAIILKHGTMEFSILADSVTGVRLVPLGDLQSSLPTLTAARAGYLKGVTKQGLIVLDAARILSDPKIVVHEEIS